MAGKYLLPEHLPDIKVKVIDEIEQRYKTGGDYQQVSEDKWLFTISSSCDIDWEFLVLVHELVEWYLTQKHGIPEPAITAFDKKVLKQNPEANPGSRKDAPYHDEHVIANKITKLLSEWL